VAHRSGNRFVIVRKSLSYKLLSFKQSIWREHKFEEKEKMQISKSKIATSIAVLFIVTMAISMFTLPTANARDPLTVPTWAYLYATPNPVGQNQETLFIFWLDAVPPTASGAYGDRWTGFMVNIMKPSGTNDTIGPYKSDAIGGSYATYTPTEVGNYTIQLIFPGNVITGLPSGNGLPMNNPAVGDTYSASLSQPYTLIVQEQPIQQYQETPLPTDYWTRPINGINRNWYKIAGNWLNAGDTGPGAPGTGPTKLYNPYSTGPESAHVMWAREYWAGGIMGGQNGESYYNGQSYEIYWNTPIILNGKFYYSVQTPPRYGYYCADIRTGETEYFYNTTGPVVSSGYPGANPSGTINQQLLAFGQVYNYKSPNQEGGFPYLWSTTAATPNTWMMYDAYTGNYICSIVNTTSPLIVNGQPVMTSGFFGPTPVMTGATGTQVYGKDGSILRYNVVNLGTSTDPQYRLQVWNTSRVLWWNTAFNNPNYDPSAMFSSFYYWEWRPYLNSTYDGNKGYSLNVTIPAVQGSIRAVREDQFVIGGTTGSNNELGIVQGNLWALSLKQGEEGKLLWNITFTPPKTAVPSTKSATGVTMNNVDPEDGVFTFSESVTRTRWVYSLEDGTQLWQSEPETQGAFYGMSEDIYDGMLLAGGTAAGMGNPTGYSGHIIAYNITTGEILWDYASGNTNNEAPYDNVPINIGCIADGKLYTFSAEHSPTQPMWRSSYIRCINASNGAELWRITHWGNNPAIADGYLIDLNLFDNRIYCYGKGPSATTVTASPKATTYGDDVLIEGTITDQSTGTKDTPAISDRDQQLWMEYLYMQRPQPTNATGVPVSLDTIDPNGNFVHIGDTTSDSHGNYALPYNPEVPGTYQIIANFKGSASYGSSSASTYITVGNGPTSTPEPTTPPQSLADLYIVPAIIGVVVVIILLVAIIILMLRKRP
jgi:hypothetical protein